MVRFPIYARYIRRESRNEFHSFSPALGARPADQLEVGAEITQACLPQAPLKPGCDKHFLCLRQVKPSITLGKGSKRFIVIRTKRNHAAGLPRLVSTFGRILAVDNTWTIVSSTTNNCSAIDS